MVGWGLSTRIGCCHSPRCRARLIECRYRIPASMVWLCQHVMSAWCPARGGAVRCHRWQDFGTPVCALYSSKREPHVLEATTKTALTNSSIQLDTLRQLYRQRDQCRRLHPPLSGNDRCVMENEPVVSSRAVRGKFFAQGKCAPEGSTCILYTRKHGGDKGQPRTQGGEWESLKQCGLVGAQAPRCSFWSLWQPGICQALVLGLYEL